MARTLTSIPDTDAPNAEYPSGRIRNEDSPIVGTPVIEELFGDIIQFFHKLIRLGGITLNGLPESETNTFQLIAALQAYIKSVSGSVSAPGVWQSASDAETQAGLLTTKVVTPASLQSKVATTSAKGIIELATGAEAQAGTSSVLAITPLTLQNVTATESRRGIATIASNAEVLAGTDISIVTPAGLAAKDAGLITKIVNIWSSVLPVTDSNKSIFKRLSICFLKSLFILSRNSWSSGLST